jgi:ABC-type transporter Mla subunit MlaD
VLLTDLATTVKNVNATVSRFNEQALSPANMKDLQSSMEHLNAATGALAESSKKMDAVVEKAGNTMGSAKQAADDLQKAIVDARQTIRSTNDLLKEASHGHGLLATLLTNRQLAADLEALVTNLRRHGVLFYHDSAAPTQTEVSRPPRRETPR